MTLPRIHPFLMALLDSGARARPDAPPPGDPDWVAILDDAEQHKLLALVVGRLRSLKCFGTPAGRHLERIQRAASGVAAQSLTLAAELTQILRVMHMRGLACLPLRGVALAEQLYGPGGWRPMGDIDLLVRREALTEVAQALSDMGYREIDRRPGFARTYSYTLEFLKAGRHPTLVEPHWSLAYPPFADRIDMDAVWQRSVRGRVVGLETRLLAPTDLALHLCFHVIHKRPDAPFLWWHELDLLIRQESRRLDWLLLVRVARQTGPARLVGEILAALKDRFHTPVPAEVLSELADCSASSPARPWGDWLQRRLLGVLAAESGVDGKESLAHLFTIKGFRARLWYACGILFPSTDFMLLHYGLSSRRWLGVWYLARIVHIVLQGLKGLVMHPSAWSRRR